MGTLYIVATPIGNLNDMTKRAIDTLKEVDYILCEDTRDSLKLLNAFNIKNKLISYHKFNEDEKVSSIIKDLKDNKNIALISDAGTPLISDPGYILVKKVKEENISVIGIGGISAHTTALSVSGLNTDSFTFYGFFPRNKKDQNKLIKDIESSPINTFVFYESPKRIIKTLEFLNNSFPSLKVSVSKELTKLHEKNYFGNLKTVIDKMKSDEKIESGEYTFIIEKENKKEKEEISLSIEALLIDIMIKDSVSLKDAIDILNKREDSLSKKEIYSASLNLKDLFE